MAWLSGSREDFPGGPRLRLPAPSAREPSLVPFQELDSMSPLRVYATTKDSHANKRSRIAQLRPGAA